MSYQTALQYRKWKQGSPFYFSTSVGKLSYCLQLKSHPQNPEITVYKGCCQNTWYSKAKGIIWTISCALLPWGVFCVSVIQYKKRIPQRPATILALIKKLQKQNSRKATEGTAVDVSTSPSDTEIALADWAIIFMWICGGGKILWFVDTAPLIWRVAQVRRFGLLFYILTQDQEGLLYNSLVFLTANHHQCRIWLQSSHVNTCSILLFRKIHQKKHKYHRIAKNDSRRASITTTLLLVLKM